MSEMLLRLKRAVLKADVKNDAKFKKIHHAELPLKMGVQIRVLRSGAMLSSLPLIENGRNTCTDPQSLANSTYGMFS